MVGLVGLVRPMGTVGLVNLVGLVRSGGSGGSGGSCGPGGPSLIWWVLWVWWAKPKGYPNPTATQHFFRYPTPFRVQNLAGTLPRAGSEVKTWQGGAMGRRRREVGVAGLLKFQDNLAWKNKSSSNHSYFPILPFSLFVFLRFSSVLDEGSYDPIVGGTKNTQLSKFNGCPI